MGSVEVARDPEVRARRALSAANKRRAQKFGIKKKLWSSLDSRRRERVSAHCPAAAPRTRALTLPSAASSTQGVLRLAQAAETDSASLAIDCARSSYLAQLAFWHPSVAGKRTGQRLRCRPLVHSSRASGSLPARATAQPVRIAHH